MSSWRGGGVPAGAGEVLAGLEKRLPPAVKPSYPAEDDVVRLDLNESPFPPPPRAVRAICAEAPALNRYPEKELYEEAREAIARENGVEPGQVVIGAGGDALLATLFALFGSGGSKVLYYSPAFSMYEFYSRVYGANAMPVKLKPSGDVWIVDEAELVEKAREAKLVILDRPNNPTGSLVIGKNVVKEVLEAAHGIVVVDEAYYEFSGETVVDLVRDNDNLVVLRTFSKAYGLAGLRLGYVIASERTASIIERALSPFPVSRLALVAVREALADRDYVNKIVEAIILERERLYATLRSMEFKPYKSYANFLLVETPIEGIVGKLRSEGVYVKEVPMGNNWMRVTIGSAHDNNRFLSAVRKLIAA